MSTMSMLHHIAEILRWIPTLVLPSLLIAHVAALAVYAGLVRNWEQMRPILPRNLLVMGTFVILNIGWFSAGRVIYQVDRWRHAEDYARATQIVTLFDQGKYAEALKQRATLVAGSKAALMVDERLASEAPKIRSRAISLSNQGDYTAAVTLMTAMPSDGPDGTKRAWLLKRWEPFIQRQQAHQSVQASSEQAAFLAALKKSLTAFDQLDHEIRPRAMHLDPAAATKVNGRVTHPLAPQLLASSIQAGKLAAEIKHIDTASAGANAIKTDLIAAADALKRACETSLTYANSSDAQLKSKAADAFVDAQKRRDAVAKQLEDLERSARETPGASPATAPTTTGGLEG